MKCSRRLSRGIVCPVTDDGKRTQTARALDFQSRLHWPRVNSCNSASASPNLGTLDHAYVQLGCSELSHIELLDLRLQ